MNISNKTQTKMKNLKSFISMKQRITAIVTATFMLLQIVLPAAAAAATLLSNESIKNAMLQPQFQSSRNNSYLYEQASYDDSQYVNSKNITTFHNELLAAKLNVGAPSYVPIAGDITIFIPTYPVGKLIGDNYVQSRFIRQQITGLLGRHLINATDGASEAEQINALYSNALTFAINKNSTYKYGDNLPAQEVITLDMIWPERRIINGVSVMVPIVYLSSATIDKFAVNDHKIEFSGTSAVFKSVSLDHAKLVLGAKTVLQTKKDLLLNDSTISSEGDVRLTVGGTLNNISSSINAGDSVQIKIINGQFNNKTLLQPFTDRYGSGTRLGRVSKVVGNSVSIVAGGDIIFEGATATATGGEILLASGSNIFIQPVFTSYQRTYKEGGWEVSASSLDVVGSRLSAQEKLKLVASGGIQITASDLVSTKGGIEMLAGLGIYIADEQGYFQSNRSDKFGRTTGTGSDFESFAVRSILSSGKGILLASETGDVILKGAKITSTEGAQVKAHNGKVRLLVTKENSQHYLDTVKKGTWTIKTVHEEYVTETGIPNAIVGGLAVEALLGVDVEYAGREGATLQQQIAEYKKMPDTAWMADIYEGRTLYKNAHGNLVPLNQAVDFSKVDLAYKHIREHNTSLSPAAMAIIAICVAVAMGPAGANLIGPGGLGGATTTIGGITTTSISLNGAIAQAAMLTLTTSAAQNLAAGKGIEDTLKAMTTDDALKNLAISMATAGALNQLGDMNLELFDAKQVAATPSLGLANQAYQAVTNSIVTAGISVTINGGNSDDYLNAFKQSLAANAINTIGQNLANKISGAPDLDSATKYIAHAAMGCLTQGLTAKLSDADAKDACAAAAGGAIIAQGLADILELKTKQLTEKSFKNNGNLDGGAQAWAEQLTYLNKNGVDLSKLLAGFTAFALGGDVNSAAGAAGSVAATYKQNMLNAAARANAVVDMGLAECGDIGFEECVKKSVELKMRRGYKDSGQYSPQQIDEKIEYIKANTNFFDGVANTTAIFLSKNGSLEGLVRVPKANPDTSASGPVQGDELPEVVVNGSEWGTMRRGIYDFTETAGIAKDNADKMLQDGIGYVMDSGIGRAIKFSASYVIEKAREIDAVKASLATINAGSEAVAEGYKTVSIGSLSIVTGGIFDSTKNYLDTQPDNYDVDAHASQQHVSDGFEWLLSSISVPSIKAVSSIVDMVTPDGYGGKKRLEVYKIPSVGELYDELLLNGPTRKELDVRVSHWDGNGQALIKNNDGKLGEDLMIETLEKSTGQKFVAIQNGSGHGPDGVFIDRSTTPATIYVAEAKSSINGAGAAAPPVGSPQARLSKWIQDFDGPNYQNVDAATRANIDEIKAAYELNPVPKGLWLQVEVPKLNSSNIAPLGVTLNAW